MHVRIVSALAVSALLSLGAPAFAAVVAVPAGTPVSIALDAPLSSGSATVGQAIAITTAEPVVVGSSVVIPKGAHGMGVVKKVTKAKGKGAGELTIAFTYVLAADGTKIALSEVDHSSAGSANKGKANTAAVAATIALGPVGLFAHNMVKGKDVTLTTTQHFPSFVDANSKVTLK